MLQSVRHLSALAYLNDDETMASLGNLERALGVAQHHDAVSGTERQHVAYDYAKRLSIGADMAIKVAGKALYKFGIIEEENVVFCSLLNISQCQPIENVHNITLVLYNPLPRLINYWLSIPTTSNDYTVTQLGTKEKLVKSEYTSISSETSSIPERISAAMFNLVFNVDLEPNSLNKYSIVRQNKKIKKAKKSYQNGLAHRKNVDDSFSLENQYIKMYFNENGELYQLDNLQNRISTSLSQSFCIYRSMNGNNSVRQNYNFGI